MYLYFSCWKFRYKNSRVIYLWNSYSESLQIYFTKIHSCCSLLNRKFPGFTLRRGVSYSLKTVSDYIFTGRLTDTQWVKYENFTQLCQLCISQNFHTRKLGEFAVFYVVIFRKATCLNISYCFLKVFI